MADGHAGNRNRGIFLALEDELINHRARFAAGGKDQTSFPWLGNGDFKFCLMEDGGPILPVDIQRPGAYIGSTPILPLR